MEPLPQETPCRSGLPWKRLLLAGAALCLGLLAVEGVLRLKVCANARSWGPFLSPVVESSYFWRDDAVLHHLPKSNSPFTATGRLPGLEFCVYGRTSPEGLNDDALKPKEPDTFRLLVLGDSFVEAEQVHRGENFCDLLEQELINMSGRPVEVINGGVSSSAPILQYLFYTTRARSWKPDGVLQVFFVNDVFGDLMLSRFAEWDEEGRPLAVRPSHDPLYLPRETDPFQRDLWEKHWEDFPSGVGQFLYTAMLLQRPFHRWQARKIWPTPPPSDQFFILEDNPDFSDLKKRSWRRTLFYMDLLRQACEKDGVFYGLTTAPLPAQVHGEDGQSRFATKPPKADKIQERLRQWAAEKGVPFVDTLSPLRRAGKRVYFPYDGHWNAAGHTVVAKALLPLAREWIKKSGNP